MAQYDVVEGRPGKGGGAQGKLVGVGGVGGLQGSWLLIVTVCVAATSGILFGYDLCVITGARGVNPAMQLTFHILRDRLNLCPCCWTMSSQ